MIGLSRPVELLLAFVGLLGTLPLVAVACCLVRITSPGPIFFLQTRVGRGGRPFTLIKLRTMRIGGGPEITVRGDGRVTSIGRLLRRTKIDELPQLWNVVRGELSLVGPRPEVPAYVDTSDPLWQFVLSVRPGLTDPVTLRLRREEDVLAELAATTGEDPETAYHIYLQPWKLQRYGYYLLKRTAWGDLRCLLATLGAPWGLSFGLHGEPPTLEEILADTPG